ncbi:hypothetical protein ABT097_10205 [Streptomyces sp. NPDC002225]|uniref:hypothetical protein n=1 Tax=Streptomyces sp. NPDC002225 TaxID=3154413 RepID=UPI00331B7FDE
MTHHAAPTCTLAPHGDTTALRLTLANPTPEPVTCSHVTITHRRASGPEPDRPADHQHEPPTASSGTTNWDLQPAGTARHELRPADPVTITPGTSLDILLKGLRPTQGSTHLEVTCHTTSAATQPPPAVFTITGPTEDITSFWAEPADVKAGTPFTLRWTAKAPKAGLAYTICYGDTAPVPVNSFMKGQDGTWTCPGIQKTTAFALLATTTSGNDTLTSARTLTVGVGVPNLTVGRLSADGTVTLFTRPTPVLPLTTTHEPRNRTHHPTTDGLVAAHIRPGTDCANALLRLRVTTIDPDKVDSTGKHLTVVHSAETLAPDSNAPRNLLVPVPKGATLAAYTMAAKGSYTAQVTWYPMGTGSLDAI